MSPAELTGSTIVFPVSSEFARAHSSPTRLPISFHGTHDSDRVSRGRFDCAWRGGFDADRINWLEISGTAASSDSASGGETNVRTKLPSCRSTIRPVPRLWIIVPTTDATNSRCWTIEFVLRIARSSVSRRLLSPKSLGSTLSSGLRAAEKFHVSADVHFAHMNKGGRGIKSGIGTCACSEGSQCTCNVDGFRGRSDSSGKASKEAGKEARDGKLGDRENEVVLLGARKGPSPSFISPSRLLAQLFSSFPQHPVDDADHCA